MTAGGGHDALIARQNCLVFLRNKTLPSSLLFVLAACSFSPTDAEIAAGCGVSQQDMEKAQADILSKTAGSFSSVGKCKLVKAQGNTFFLATIEQFGSKH
jgi:hypothetical protein